MHNGIAMRILLAALAFAATATSASAASDAAPFAPFHAEYAAVRNGESLGTTTLVLSDNHDGTWTLRSETTGTSGLAKLAGIHIVETSHFRWHDGRPVAIDYDYRQDSAIKKRTRHAVFDPKSGEALVEEGGESFRYATAPDLIDRPRILVDGEAIEAGAEQVVEVPAVAAAGVEHAMACVEAALQQLIEQIDVDVRERLAQRGARRHARGAVAAGSSCDAISRSCCAWRDSCAARNPAH